MGSRQWKTKSTSAVYDTSDWPEPAEKLIFKVVLSDIDVVVGLDLGIIDVTVAERNIEELIRSPSK